MKSLSIIGLLLSAAILSLGNYMVDETPYFQWSDWVAPKSADALKNPLKGDEAAAAAGQQLFSAICFVCHGNKGKGDGINAPSLSKKPADLTSLRVQRQSDGALFWKISEGNPPMLSFKESLSEEQRWQLVNYVRKLPKLYPPEKADEVASKAPKKIPTSATETAPAASQVKSEAKEEVPVVMANPFEGVADGKQLFRSICMACHSIGQGKMVGPDLKGVNNRHEKEWLFRWIRSSQRLVKSGDPEAVRLFEENNRVVMTDHDYLADSQIESILGYIELASNAGIASRQTETSISRNPGVVAMNARPVSVYSKMLNYFLYIGFAFVIVTLLMVVHVLNKIVK